MQRKTNNKKSTYQEIAQEARVSIATVSRILTGSSAVREETRLKVLDAMAKQGFDITELLINHPAPKNRIIIFNIPSLGNPFYSEIIRGAKFAAMRHHYQLLINEEQIDNTSFSDILNLAQKFDVAGMIVANYMPPDLLRKLNDTLPLVQCCEYNNELEIPFVSIDNVAAAKTSVEYLLSLGRQNIALINSPPRHRFARDRLKGYLDALEKAGIEQKKELIIQLPDKNYDMAISTASHLLDSAGKPDAFFCIDDVLAAAVIRVCARMSLRVPQDVMVVGFDNVDISFMMSPSITTTNQPRFHLGFSSCELLVELINNPDTPVRQILLETELVVRESTSL